MYTNHEQSILQVINKILFANIMHKFDDSLASPAASPLSLIPLTLHAIYSKPNVIVIISLHMHKYL